VHGVREINLSELQRRSDRRRAREAPAFLFQRGQRDGGVALFTKSMEIFSSVSRQLPGPRTTPMGGGARQTISGYTYRSSVKRVRHRPWLCGPSGKAPDYTCPPNVNLQGGLTLHQGGIVDTPSGEWMGLLNDGPHSIGRLVCLSPVTWTDGWPYYGLPGNLKRSPVIWVNTPTASCCRSAPLRNEAMISPGQNSILSGNGTMCRMIPNGR